MVILKILTTLAEPLRVLDWAQRNEISAWWDEDCGRSNREKYYGSVQTPPLLDPWGPFVKSGPEP